MVTKYLQEYTLGTQYAQFQYDRQADFDMGNYRVQQTAWALPLGDLQVADTVREVLVGNSDGVQTTVTTRGSTLWVEETSGTAKWEG